MATTIRLVLVGSSWPASTANGTPLEWVHDHDEAVVTLGDENQEFKNEQDGSHANEQAESPAERARRLLAELEQEGAALEESFKDDSFLQDLAVFPDMAKPDVEAALPMDLEDTKALPMDIEDIKTLPMDLEDTDALLMDLVNILPPDASPPHSPTPFCELEELLQLRAQEVLPDPLDLLEDVLPPTPADSGASSPGPQSSPSYAPSTPASIYSDSSNDPEWSPEPLPGPSKTRRKSHARKRMPTDRFERKKLQNKNAATRYRTKKKVEEEELLQEEAEIIEINRRLKEKVNEMEMEMRIVKDLLKTKFKRMGLIK